MINILPINIKYLIFIEILWLMLLFSTLGFLRIWLNDIFKMSQKYKRIFWIGLLIIVQGVIGCMLWKYQLARIELTTISVSIIENTTPFTLTANGKIAYFFYYLEMSMELTTINIEDRIMLRNMTRQLDLKTLLEDKAINDIKFYIDGIIDNYLQYRSEKTKIYPLVKNIIVISAVTTTIMNLRNFYAIYTQVQDPSHQYIIAHKIMKLFQGMSQERYAEILAQSNIYLKDHLYSFFDIILYAGVDVIPLQLRVICTGIFVALFGTFVLPKLANSFESLSSNEILPINMESSRNDVQPIHIEELVIFLKDMSMFPIIAPYNKYYILGTLLVLKGLMRYFSFRRNNNMKRNET